MSKIFLCLLISLFNIVVFAGTLEFDLYRSGNATTAQMDKIRTKDTPNVKRIDVDTYVKDGVVWVKANNKGISTQSTKPPATEKNWWVAPKGTAYSDKLKLHNDHTDHYMWVPKSDMPLSEYDKLMKQVNVKFTKIEVKPKGK